MSDLLALLSIGVGVKLSGEQAQEFASLIKQQQAEINALKAEIERLKKEVDKLETILYYLDV